MTLDPRELGDDEAAWLVLADQLQHDGDPRGELIVLQHRLALHPDDTAARARERYLMSQYADYLVGPAAGWKPIGPAHEARHAGSLQLEWRLGFIRRAWLRRGEHPSLETLFAHESFSLLAELWLDERESGRWQRYADYVPELARAAIPPSLRSLTIGPHVERSPSWAGEGYCFIDVDISAQELGELGPIWPLVPGLEHLALRGNYLDLGERIALPALRSFEIVTSGLARKDLLAITAAEWPRLERLVVWFGDGEYGGGNCTTADVLGLLRDLSIRTPHLVELGIANAPWLDELCVALGRSPPPLLSRLRALDLSHGTLGIEGARALVAIARDHLGGLRELNVASSFLGPDEIAMLQQALPGCRLLVGRLRDPTFPAGQRYVSVSE